MFSASSPINQQEISPDGADTTPTPPATSAEIIYLRDERARRERLAGARIDANNRQRIIKRAAAVSAYAQSLERAAIAGSQNALDWVAFMDLPGFERAIAESLELREKARTLMEGLRR